MQREQYGRKGWGGHRSAVPIFADAAARADAAAARFRAYYTPELLARVRAAYAMDYAMLEALGFFARSAPGRGVPAPGPRTLCSLDPGRCAA